MDSSSVTNCIAGKVTEVSELVRIILLICEGSALLVLSSTQYIKLAGQAFLKFN